MEQKCMKFLLLKPVWNDTRDLCFFTMSNSRKSNFPGKSKTGYCHGSPVCPNPKCPFLDTSEGQQPNRIHWKTFRGDNKRKVCQICDDYTIKERCEARK